MHPVLKPGFAPTTRDLHTLQLGRSALRTLVLPDDAAVRQLLRALDGSRSRAQIEQELVASHTMTHERFTYLFDLLLDAGVLDDASRPPLPPRGLPHTERRRLHDDVEAWTRSRPEPSSGSTTWRRRRAVWIEVDGAGRLAVGIAHLLALSGVTHISVRDRAAIPVASTDLAPLGPHADAVGASTLEAVQAAVARTAPDRLAPVPAPDHCGDPDLVILVGAPHSPRADNLVRRGVPHLFVHADLGHGVVGPLTVSGRTACGGCVERHRRDHDRTREWVMDQAPDTVEALDTATATATSALAVAQALQHIEGRTRPASCDGLLVLDAVTGLPELHPMPQHPHCGCSWVSAPEHPSRTMAA